MYWLYFLLSRHFGDYYEGSTDIIKERRKTHICSCNVLYCAFHTHKKKMTVLIRYSNGNTWWVITLTVAGNKRNAQNCTLGKHWLKAGDYRVLTRSCNNNEVTKAIFYFRFCSQRNIPSRNTFIYVTFNDKSHNSL